MAISEGESESKDDQVKIMAMVAVLPNEVSEVDEVYRRALSPEGGLRWISLRPTQKIQIQATLMTSFPPNCSWYIACILTQQSSYLYCEAV